MSKLQIAAIALAVASMPLPATADDAAGTVKLMRGGVHIERAGKTVPATIGAPVMGADRIVTAADGTVGITLRDNTRLTAGPNSVLSLDKYAFDGTTHGGQLDATVKKGTLAVVSGKLAASSPESVSFRTPTATLGVRGTQFLIDVPAGGKD